METFRGPGILLLVKAQNSDGLIAARHDGAASPVLSKLLAKGGLD